MAPGQIVRWIGQAYPKPRVSEEWLDACCEWIANDMQLNPDTQTDAFIRNVENQLLESDLCDSMQAGTGFARNAAEVDNMRINGTPILVEVTSITEIGHSAFNLHNVRQTRIERADLAGLAEEEGVEEDEGPVPSYPRTMLKLEVCDGSVTLPAIEYKALHQLKLAETPLGFKIVLKDVLVRRGVIFLEPHGIELKGHKNDDRDEFRDRDFVRGLFRRMMKPVPEDEQPQDDAGDESAPRGPPPAPQAQATVLEDQVRSPLRELSEPPERRIDMDVDDYEAEIPRKRRVPNPTTQPLASSSASSSGTLVASRFFAGPSSLTAGTATSSPMPRIARVLSPVRGDPIDITDSSMEDARLAVAPHARSRTAAGKQPIKAPALRSKISFEDFEFDDDDAELDADFLAAVAKVEKEALLTNTVAQAVSNAQSRPNSRPPEPEGTKGRRMQTPVTAPSSSSNSTSVPSSSSRARAPEATQPRPRIVHDVITIEDDEEDDKENVPVPKRRVRRRVVPDTAVIDLSD